MRKGIVLFLILVFSIFSLNKELSCLANEIVNEKNSSISSSTDKVIFNESFLLQPQAYVTINITNTLEFTEYVLNLTQSITCNIRLFIVDEENFILFKSNKSFYEINGWSIRYYGGTIGFLWSLPSSIFLYGTEYITIKQIGKIIFILSNGGSESLGVVELIEKLRITDIPKAPTAQSYDEDFDLEPAEDIFYTISVLDPPKIIEVIITVEENPNISLNYVNVKLSQGFLYFWDYSFDPFNITRYENSTSEAYSFATNNYPNKFVLMDKYEYFIILGANNINGVKGHFTVKDITSEIMTTSNNDQKSNSSSIDTNGISTEKTDSFILLYSFVVILILVVLKRRSH